MPRLCVDTISNDLMTRNAFLISRLVLLALFTHLAFLSLIFASWNISATLSAMYTTPGTSIFIIFESCLVFFFVAFAVADVFLPRLKTSKIILECGCVGVLSVFHIASAINVSVNSFASACHLASTWSVCASASLLMPLTWLNSILFLGYFLFLFVATMAHKTLYPHIWTRSLHDVEWFGPPPELPLNEKDTNPFFSHYEEIESTAARKKLYCYDSVEEPAPWTLPTIRRGVDPPFARKPSQERKITSPFEKLSPLPPILSLSIPNPGATPSTFKGTTSGSRFVEKFRESMVLARPESPRQYVNHYHTTRTDPTSFPRSVENMDKPIPLPKVSEWVRADALQLNLTGNSKKQSGNHAWI